jgi:hypothetical protein
MRHDIELCVPQFALFTVQHTDTDGLFGMDHSQAPVTFISRRFLYGCCSLYHKAAQETVVVSCFFRSHLTGNSPQKWIIISRPDMTGHLIPSSVFTAAPIYGVISLLC